MRAHRLGHRELQVGGLGRVELDQGDAAGADLARHRHHRHRIRAGSRAHQPPLEERIQPAHAQAARGHGEHVGFHLGRFRCGQLNLHPLLLSSRAHWETCALEFLAQPPAAASRSGTATAPPARRLAAANGARPRTQSSIAIRGAEGPWFLANASPDLREQLEGLGAEGVNDVRAAPVAAVLLTDAEIDHAAGLLLLRESSTPIRVYGSDQVRQALTDGYPVLRMLGDYSGVEWRTLEPADTLSLDGSSLEVESFATGGDAPRYLEGTGADVEATGLVFRDRSTGGVLTYVPGLARLDDDVLGRLAASDVVLVDGTFWRDDELAQLGISDRTAAQMGHVPLSGPGGTLEVFAGLERPRVILVHINNTNPVLLEDSPERDAVLRAGVEVGYDGLEIEL